LIDKKRLIIKAKLEETNKLTTEERDLISKVKQRRENN